MSQSPVEIACEVMHASDNALHIYDGDKEVWIPRQFVISTSYGANGRVDGIVIPEWLAMDRGLI